VQIAFTNIDELEKVVHILAHGDILAENTTQLTETNFIRIFRLAQLAIEYLLHVQDILAAERRELITSECALTYASDYCI
jgi:zinc finger protein DZIP1